MRVHLAIAVALAAAAGLAGCGSRDETVTTVDRTLAVTGPREGVERFVKLQGSLRPPLETSDIRKLADGRATASVTVPAAYDGEDVVHITREALAAGLEYKYLDARSTATRKE